MKKSLLIIAAFVVALSASAQKTFKKANLNGLKFDKTSVMASMQYEKPASASFKTARRAAVGSLYGSYVASELSLDEETYECFAVTFEEANLTEDGVTYNVKIKDFWMKGTELYGVFDEANNTLRIPNQLIWANESLEGLGYTEATKTFGPLEILNINGEDVNENDLLFEYNPEEGVFTFDESQSTAYYIYADGKTSDGEDVGGWTYASEVRIAPYNGVMSFNTTAEPFQTQAPREGSNWGYGEMPINFEDWDTSYTINGFLGSGCVSVGYDAINGTATMAMHQPLSTDNYGEGQGYMQLFGVVVNAEEGTISFDKNVENMNGDYYPNVLVDGRPADVIMFYGVDEEQKVYTYNEYFIPLTEGDEPYWMGGYFCRLDITFYKDGGAGINETKTNGQKGNSRTFNLMGQQVSANAKGLVIRDGKQLINK